MAVPALAAPTIVKPAADAGEKLMVALSKAANQDILVVRHRFHRPLFLSKEALKRFPKKAALPTEPLDVELHVNPVGIVIGTIGAAIGGFLLFGEFKTGGFWSRSEVTLYKGPLADVWSPFKTDWADKKVKKALWEAYDEVSLYDDMSNLWNLWHSTQYGWEWKTIALMAYKRGYFTPGHIFPRNGTADVWRLSFPAALEFAEREKGGFW